MRRHHIMSDHHTELQQQLLQSSAFTTSVIFVLDWKYSNIAETVVPPEQQQLTAADDDFGSDNVDRDLDDEIEF